MSEPTPRSSRIAGDQPIDLSVIIVTHGTGPIVYECLEAVRQHTNCSFEIVLVDNPTLEPEPGSAALESVGDYDNVRLIRPVRNLGFGGANNLAADAARGELLAFLNPDCVVSPGWAEPLIAAHSDPAVAVAAPVLLNADGTIQEAGQLIYDDGCTAAIGGPEVLTGDETQLFSRDVDYASAACWVVRRGDHLARGGFDDRYWPAYFEDADYAMAAAIGGKVTRLVVDRPVVHFHGLGDPVGERARSALAERSRDAFRERWDCHLPDMSRRPRSDIDAIRARDRACVERHLFMLNVADPTEDLRAISAAARVHARNRYTVVGNDLPGLLGPAALADARRAGVEVLSDLSAEAIEQRRSLATTVSDPSRRSRWQSGVWSVVLVVSILVTGVGLRVVAAASRSGAFNADEAYTGIEAGRILAGELSVKLGGAAYTLATESYLYAPVSAMFGESIWTLRALPVLFWALTAFTVGVAVRDRVGDRSAMLAAGLVWITPGPLLTVSLLAYASYASGMFVIAVVFWSAARLIDDAEPSAWRSGSIGLLSGLGFWMHPMFLAVLVPVLFVVATVLMRRRQIGRLLVVAIGGLVGCAPLLAWNATSGWPSLDEAPAANEPYLDRLWIMVSDLVPRAIGLRSSTMEWVHGRTIGTVLYLAVVGLAACGVALGMRRDRRISRVLLPAALVAALPMMALFPALTFVLDGRYGIIVLPLLAMAVAQSASGRVLPRTAQLRWLVVLAVWVGALVAPQVEALRDEADSTPNAAIHEVVNRLRAADVEYVSGSYWRVHTVDFLSNGDIVGSASEPQIVRFPTLADEVDRAPDDEVAFVFQTSDDDPSVLRLPRDAYRREVIGDTVLYVPSPLAPSEG